MSGSIESVVANRAEAQRYFGLEKSAMLEGKLAKNVVQRMAGPAFMANASRNFIMSSTSFVLTPLTFKHLYPQEKKSKQSLFWFGLGMNIFIGNSIAITQQALWGRALDYMAVGGGRRSTTRLSCERASSPKVRPHSTLPQSGSLES